MLRSDRFGWKRGKRWLYLVHRWTGIALCLLFAIWFVSGVVMMYVPFPSFRDAERVAMAQPIRWDLVRHGPDAALAALGADHFPQAMRLEMTGGEPVYRITDDDRRAVSALTGREIGGVDAARAGAIASALTGASVRSTDLIERDQWTTTRAFARIAPMWRVRMADDAGTDIYVSRATGEVVQNTDARERLWNWLGAVPHWIYFTALRQHQEPWRQVVMWTSGIGIVGAVLGIWIGILRLRVKRRYNAGAITPYRGWMKWHHLAGLVGGLFLVTWVFSGWWSMSPFGGTGDGDAKAIAERYAGRQTPRFVATDMAMLARTAAGAAEVRFLFIGERATMLAVAKDGATQALDGATGLPRPAHRPGMEALARAAVPGGRLVSTELLTRPDLYWYATGDPRRDGRPLPVLRLKFDDANASWLHVDPATAMLLGQSSIGRRSYRWLFSALHSFDLPLLLAWRPLRDGLMILLSLAGLVISVSGVVVGWRYLRRPRARSRPKRAAG